MIDAEELKQVPGAYEAYKGLTSLNFLVCKVFGSKVIIDPIQVAEFQNCPPSVRLRLEHLQKEHETNCASMLSCLSSSTEVEKSEDPRPTMSEPGSTGSTEAAGAQPAEDGPSPATAYDTEDALKQAKNIVGEVKAMNNAALSLLLDSEGALYGISKNANLTLTKGTVLGSVGHGRITDADPTKTTSQVPYALSEADKSLVELAEREQEQDLDAAPGQRGTLYMIAKSLQKKHAGREIIISSYGKLMPTTVNCVHGYAFAIKEDSDEFRKLAFTMKAASDSKSTAGNFFKTFAGKSTLPGLLCWIWRFNYELVHSKLQVRKPLVGLNCTITFEKGKPVKLT